MRKILLAIPLLWLAQILQAAQPTLPALSVPVTDNAVAAMKNHGHWTLYSFMGIGAKKTWDDITPASYALEPGAKKWELTRPVPGPVGRIGVAAVAARDHIFLFGGFVADRGGRGTAVPDVNVYEPSADRWWRGADMPVPVGDAVASPPPPSKDPWPVASLLPAAATAWAPRPRAAPTSPWSTRFRRLP